jgi:hypothetical protein
LQTHASELGYTVEHLNNQLKLIGHAAGPPWRTDQRRAATVAWIALGT